MLQGGVLAAMRHIIYANGEKLFSFSLPDAGLARLCGVSEAYLIAQTERKYKTLDFYRQIVTL